MAIQINYTCFTNFITTYAQTHCYNLVLQQWQGYMKQTCFQIKTADINLQSTGYSQYDGLEILSRWF